MQLADALANSKIEKMSKSGYFSYMEALDHFADVVSTFFTKYIKVKGETSAF